MKKAKNQKVKFVIANAARAPRRMAPRRKRASNGVSTPLLPLSVNNNATVPHGGKSYRMRGTEYFGDPIQLTNNAQAGTLIFNRVITMAACPRLQMQSKCWQRYKIRKLKFKVVPLNGSTADSGYTATLIDDPAYVIRSDIKGIVNLTAFADTSVRQSWVMTDIGTVELKQMPPPLFVQTTGDVRLYSPGRAVIQLNGSPVNATGSSVTFVPMLDYDIEFFAPGVDSGPVDQEDFNVAWSNNQRIGIVPGGSGLVSAASRAGLVVGRTYYLAQPVPVAVVIGGNNGVQWCIGFRTLVGPGGSWADDRPIRTPNPADPAFDVQGITPVAGLGENLFFPGSEFSNERPAYTVPS